MSLPPYWAPTGKLLVPIGTQTLVGDIVSGGGIIPGTTVISIATIAGTIGDYLELTLSQTPGTFSAVSVPSGVTNHNQQSTSSLTGLNLGYTSNIIFSRLISSQAVEILNIPNKTLSFKEDVKGWVSFKSFVPENGISLASDYHTVLNGKLYKHHIEDVNRNHFYGVDYNSSINVILNDGPGSVKSFHTLDYEGSQSKIDIFSTDATTGLSDAQPYNLVSQDGWYVSSIETDKQEGNIQEFIEKEGKWFNYIKGVDSDITSKTDFGAFDIQGLGIISNIVSNKIFLDGDLNSSLQVSDTIYFQTPGAIGAFDTISSDQLQSAGVVSQIGPQSNGFHLASVAGLSISIGDYIMFAKNHVVNTSSLLGYFADVKFENNSTEKIELFSVGSEITQSSK